ncbi:hypothetical protein C8R47DRAFT_931085, partial [Mycena vitilis]
EQPVQRQEVNARKQGPKESFMTFATAVRSSNSLLINTPSHVDDGRIRVILEANMLMDLSDDVHDDGKPAAETDFNKWLAEVKRLDEKRTRGVQRMQAIVEERAKRERNMTHNGDDRPAKRKRDENAPPSTATTSTSSTGKRCPKLSDSERDLLLANNGCTKCRTPFVAHAYDREKTCNFPSPDNYKAVTRATVDAAAAVLTPEQRKAFGLPPKSKPSAVAAVVDADAAAAAAADVNAVAATGFGQVVNPDDSLGTDDADLSSRNVSSPFRTPHLFWDFRMEGPLSNLPIHVRGLIDDGAHLVLIDEDIVQRLDLRRFRLPKPEPVDVAMNNNTTESVLLTEYVK